MPGTCHVTFLKGVRGNVAARQNVFQLSVSPVSVASPLLFHEFRWARFCFYCEKKAISDQSLLTASGRLVIYQQLWQQTYGMTLSVTEEGIRHKTHTSRRVQTHNGGGSRTLQTSPSYTARIIALICLLTGEHGRRKNARSLIWAQTCSLQIAVRS